MPYGLDCKINANYVFQPKLWDAFSNSLEMTPSYHNYRAIYGRTGKATISFRGTRRAYDPTLQLPKFLQGTPIESAINTVLKAYHNNKGWVDPLASAALMAAKSFLMVDREAGEDEPHYLDSILVRQQLREFLRMFKDTPLAQRYNLSQAQEDLKTLQRAD